MKEGFPKPEDGAEALRQELAARFPGVDAAALEPGDMEIFAKARRGIPRKEFDDWRTGVIMQSAGARDNPREKLMIAMNRDLRPYESKGDILKLP